MSVARSSVTSWMEILGLLLLAAAVSVEVARFTLPGAIASGGVLLILESAVLTWRAAPRKLVLTDVDETA